MRENYYYVTPDDIKEAQKNGIPERTVYERVYKLGWTRERARTEKVHKKKHYLTEEDYKRAKENGIDKGTLKARLNNLGWDLEKAISTPKIRGAKPKYPLWAKEKAKENGIPIQTFRNRINMYNWDIERACTEKPNTVEERLAKMRKAYKERYREIT